jgi:dephospho-CoA kinase
MTKPLIGLTGGIASGKSTVASQLSALGVWVIDADALAREVVVQGSEGLAEVVRVFGVDVLLLDGSLDREQLGRRVFADAEARKQLNGIIHPRIGKLSAERVEQASSSNAPYVVYEAPLLVETGANRGMAALIVVAAAPEVQLARVTTRDGLTLEAAQARLAAQLPLDVKLAAADYVIHNDGDRAHLLEQVDAVHRQILERFVGSSSASSH